MPWKFSPTHSQVAWECRYLGIMTIKGLFTNLEVVLDQRGDDPRNWGVEARIDPASIDSGLPRRDEVLRGPDYLDAEHYPSIVFRATRLEPRDGGYRATGELTIHGVTRPIVLDLVDQGETTGPRGQRYHVVTTDVTLKRTDFGVGQPPPPGTGVADEVRLSCQIEFVWED
jgi:polyisoprenoid-binding protein YceI